MHVRRTFWGEIFFWKAHSFLIISGLGANGFQSFDKKFLERVVTTGFCVSRWCFFIVFQGRNWRKNYFFRKKIALLSFRDFERKSYFWRHGYGRLVKTSIYMFRRTFWQIGFLESSSDFHNFWNSSRTFFRILTKNFKQCGHNWVLCTQMKCFLFFEGRKVYFFWNFRIAFFSDFERKRSSVLLQARLRQACQKFVVNVQTKIF